MNEQDVRACYRFLSHEKQTEIRLIDPNLKQVPKQVFVSSENEFVKTCKQYNGKYNVYVGINEREHNQDDAKHVVSVKTIILDIDPKRPDMKQPSTDKELQHADKTASQITYDLLDEGFVPPMKIMSGNGIQLWFSIPEIRIDDSNRKNTEDKIKLFHKKIKKLYEDKNVNIDNIGDLPRIIKVVGTLSIKGENTKERPHRMSKCLSNNFARIEDTTLRKYVLLLDEEEQKEEQADEFSLLPLDNILKEDPKFFDLFMGEWERYGYKSRSEAEISLIVKLLMYGYEKNQVFAVLGKSKIGKWDQSPQYREHTFDKAVDFYKKNITTLKDVNDVFRKWMHMPDEKRINVMLAVAISRKMTGKPLWLIIIGPSGDGKSEQAMACKDAETTYILHELTSRTLVSGNPKADDLAPMINNKLVIVPDMAQMLTLEPTEKGRVWAQLRELYDGRAGRATGMGQDVKYDGLRITMLMCSTPTIDGQILIFQDLGTRELMWRMIDGNEKSPDDNELMDKVIGNIGMEEIMAKEISSVVTSFIKTHSPKKMDISKGVLDKLKYYVNYVIFMRATAEIDGYTGELRNLVYPEKPTRLLLQFMKLYICLKSLDPHFSDQDALDIICHVAKSSVPPIRRKILDKMIEMNTESTMSEISTRVKLGKKTVLRELSILWNLNLVNRKTEIEQFSTHEFEKHYWSINNKNEIIKKTKSNLLPT